MAKAILYKSKKLSSEEHPIVIRWYENGRQRVFTVGSCTEKQWNADKGQVKKNHPFYEQINDRIRERLSEAIANNGIIKSDQKDALLLIDVIEGLRVKAELNGQLSSKNKYTALKSDLTQWSKSAATLTLDAFTDQDAESFYSFLILGKKNSKNTAAKKMANLGSVFTHARKRKLTLNDPLLNLTFPKTAVVKNKLTREELTILEEIDLTGSNRNIQIARDAFIMQFYLRGIRVGDLVSLKPENIVSGRIEFSENKGGAFRSLPINAKVQAIIDRYKDQSKYLLPLLKVDRSNTLAYKKAIESATASVNKNLAKLSKIAGIDKKITTHIARHTFAKIAIDTVKNIRVSQELIGHKSLRVHQDYIRDLENTDELDAAADDIFGTT